MVTFALCSHAEGFDAVRKGEDTLVGAGDGLVVDDHERLVGFSTGLVNDEHARNFVGCAVFEGLAAGGGGECADSVADDLGHATDSFSLGGEREGRGSVHGGGHLDHRHEGLLDVGGARIFAEIALLVDVAHDVVREELAETGCGNLAEDGRRLEVDETAGHGEFGELGGGFGQKLKVGSGEAANLRTDHGLHAAEDVEVDDFLFDVAGELEAARLEHFLGKGLDVVEVFPDVSFHGGTLGLHVGDEFDFVDFGRVGDDAVVGLARVGQIHVDHGA